MYSLLDALTYIHSLNIIHRDVKPGNIFFLCGILKLGDFGLSKIIETNELFEITNPGTLLYMSPEILFPKKAGLKSDIW